MVNVMAVDDNLNDYILLIFFLISIDLCLVENK